MSGKWMGMIAAGVLVATSLAHAEAEQAERVVLWPDGTPGAVGEEPADVPTLEVHLPEGASESTPAVIVCPGGGYMMLADDYEGTEVAQRLNDMGVAGFVLRYRLSPRYREPTQLLDAQRAIRYVRHHAEEYGIDRNRIGVLGFSAGGHLAASTGTLIEDGDADADDPIDRESAQPNFLVLCYPVITMTDDSVMHRGSKQALLGEDADDTKAEHYSVELQVSERTPPTFLFHTDEDAGVPPENSVLFYLALRRVNVPAELHVYQPGPHGVGLGNRHPEEYPELATWPMLLENWLQSQGFVERE